MRNSELDCIFHLSNGPGSALADLSGELEVRILSIEQKRIALLIHNHLYWHLGIIERDVCTELDKEVTTLDTPTQLITHMDVPHEMVRNRAQAYYRERGLLND